MPQRSCIDPQVNQLAVRNALLDLLARIKSVQARHAYTEDYHMVKTALPLSPTTIRLPKLPLEIRVRADAYTRCKQFVIVGQQ